MAQSDVNRENSQRRERTAVGTSLDEIMKQYMESIHRRPRFYDGCTEEHYDDDDADCYCE